VGRILAVDWGGRRLGLARSDALGLTAQPLPPVVLPAAAGPPADAERRSLAAASAAIAEAALEHEVSRVVVGLPLELSGKSGDAARRVEDLIHALRARLPATIAIETWDERFTSALAERSLREEGRSAGRRSGGGRERTRARVEDKARVDQRAALLLLQSWLDAHPGGTAR
jgi:putative Holliday junction resolvase